MSVVGPVEVLTALELALRQVVAGDRDRARATLVAVRDIPLSQLDVPPWSAGPAPADDRSSRTRALDRAVELRRRVMRRWRDRRLGEAITSEVLVRDRFRCRYCGTPLVAREHLVRLAALLGDDAVAPAAGPSRGRDHEAFGPVGFVAGGVVDRVRLGRAGGVSLDNLIASCPPCRRRRAGRPLAELGLADPRRRSPEPAPEWCALLEALALPVGSARLLVEHAVLLDGATLNVGGTLIGHDGGGTVSIGAAYGGREVAAALEVIRTTPRGIEVQAHLPLHEMVFADGDVADARVRLFAEDSTPLPLIVMPGCAATANGDVVEAIPVVPGARSRLALQTTSGLVVRALALEPSVEVASVAVDDTLWIALDVVGPDARRITSVSLRRRDDPRVAALQFTRDDGGWWRLDPDDAPTQGPDASLWDVWVRWASEVAEGEARAGRQLSDLCSLRDAVVLPTCRIHRDDGDVKLVPYFTGTRHLAVKVRTTRTAQAAIAEAGT